MTYLTATQGLFVGLTALTVAVIAFRLFISPRNSQSKHPLPPGPKPRLLVGNISDLPEPGSKDWLHWKRLTDQHGPINSLTVLGQTMVIISDYKMAIDLMDKRSAHTSSRPVMEFGSKMCGWENALALTTDANKVRAIRRSLHGILGTLSAIAQFQPTFELETCLFLAEVLDKPKDFLQAIRTQAGSIILKVGYGYKVERQGRDPLVDLADEGLDQFSKACTPGAWLVDVIPALKHLPEWLPGTKFKATARQYNATVHALADLPYTFVEKQLKDGTAEPSFLSKLIGNGKGTLTPEAEDIARWSAFSLYGGGADTTVSTMSNFVLAMTIYPDVQKKAQAEIDAHIGSGSVRLPTFADRVSLPYLGAILKETLRWHPVAPMGVPHLTTKEDVYNDYLIPKNTVLIPNIWAMLHDPVIYHNPETFDPSRFLGAQPAPDPYNICFGFGRRVCPGRLFADSSLFSTIAGFLAVFEVRKMVGMDGKEITPPMDFMPGVISHPRPFECDIRPRSEEWEELIRRVEVEHPSPEHGDARELAPIPADVYPASKSS